jgi:transposase
MEEVYYVGLDIHKKMIAYCIKQEDGVVFKEGKVAATREALKQWAKDIQGPWKGAMEATLFTGWVYDFLKPYALALKVANPNMLKAITAAKKKNDMADAERLADLLRVNLLPECYMASQVHTAVKMKNRISGLLMEAGAEYNKQRLHGSKYFADLIGNIKDVPESVIELLKLSRAGLEMFQGVQKKLVSTLRDNQLIRERVERLMTIPGIGELTALTWVLEVGEVERFKSVRQAVSYCGLCSAQKESAGKERRGPISKKRNRHLQTILTESAKLAPRWNAQLAEVHARELVRGNRNRATLAVARKLVAYMLAVDKSGDRFKPIRIKEAA